MIMARCYEKVCLQKCPPEEGGFIPKLKLYIKSDYEFGPAVDEMKQALHEFRKAINAEQQQCMRRRKSCREPHNDSYIVVHMDKNLGPCIIDRCVYVFKGCKEYSGNAKKLQATYKVQSK